ncbi:hypothetical protein PFICI_04049 [Pestalotiopsis fici W106-1]|uniref:Uncharacterized protein n=1 Tax=Pestalotiopsis fici (strain W106-1 / CGMCC3.15140) TaxID=1229662 RepID=W3XJ27_PESFW|nr:uncharacterized protein PFICI_04049 [Pestalotiopsis fici W106-1]ETS86024.1 hypothetical protein PFICI_04049 [Pestalotiopsis fici W106-1]
MADPLSIASGIAGLLSLAGAAFHVVHQYIRTAKDAKDFVKALSKELQSLSSVLQGVKILAEAYEQDETEPSVGLRLEHISACSRVLDDILKGTSSIRDTVKNQKSRTSKVENLKWPFRKSKTDELINELSRHKATLSLALDAASLSALVDCLGKVKRECVLNFFMPIDPSPNLQSSWKLRHPGTGIWLTESLRFRTWLLEEGSKIWLSGIPGAGKTVLAGAAIREALQQVATVSNVGVAFFFCDYKNKKTWNITNILGAIATQLAWQNESAFAKLKQYHNEIKPRQGMQLRPKAEDLHEVIIEESEAFDRILLVVDGLDECGDNAEIVSRVLSRLNQDIPNLSSALFSRDEPGIRDVLQDQFDQIDIAAHSEDISLYVGAELEKRIEQRQLRINDMHLKDEILLILTTGAQGMFRWVACQLDALGECITDADRRTALYELPKTLPETYERILVRVNQKRRSVQRLVQLTLRFLAIEHPIQLLTAAGLCHFVSVPEKSGTKWDISSVVTEQEVARACSSFLRKSADGRLFEFAHFSVREYLQNSSLLERPDLKPYHISKSSINDTVASQYLRFLQLKNFDCKPCRAPGDGCGLCAGKENLGSLYTVAAASWPMHVQAVENCGSHSSAELLELQKSLLHPAKSNVYMNWVTRFCWCLHQKVNTEYVLDLVLEPSLSTLHVAAALDLTEVGTWLLGTYTTINSEVQADSLLEFSIAGIFAFVKDVIQDASHAFSRYKYRSRTASLMDQLSSRGAKLSGSSQRFQGRRLMQITCNFAACGNMTPLKCLLENGWNLCSEDISIASCWFTEGFCKDQENELRNLVKFLNTHEIHKTREGYQLCALIWNMAIRSSHKFTADTSLLPSSITLSDAALVETAVSAITLDDVQALVTCEQDVRFNIREFKDKDEVYAVHIAASWHAFKILKYMLNAGCEMRRSDSDGRNFLHMLTRSNTSRTFDASVLEEIRAQHGAEFEKLMDAVNHEGQTALDMAFEISNINVAKWLFEKRGRELSCCHGKICIWDKAANAESIALLQMLKDSSYPCHTDCSAGRPFHALNPGAGMEKFELLNTLYPSSLKSCTSAKLALESCLSRWARQTVLPYTMDGSVIQALLHKSETLSATSPAAIDFCCRIISETSWRRFERTIKILEPFLEHGIDVHPGSGSRSMLEEACNLFNITTAQVRDGDIHLLEAILDRVDNKKLNRYDRYGSSILHRVCTAPGIDPE